MCRLFSVQPPPKSEGSPARREIGPIFQTTFCLKDPPMDECPGGRANDHLEDGYQEEEVFVLRGWGVLMRWNVVKMVNWVWLFVILVIFYVD